MFEKVKLFAKILPTKLPAMLFVLFVVSFIAYGQTLLMYFLIDDNALIYKLQHPEQTLGLWGKDIWGEGPYRYRVIQFVPFYQVFGVNPLPYFAVGLTLYYFASITVYFFSSLIAKNKYIGFAAAVIFASGYVGSETMFGITNSWETNRGIIVALLTFLLYYQYLKTRKVLFYYAVCFYLASLALFYLSLETLFIRSHGLIFAFIAFDLLFGWRKFTVRGVIFSFVRILPYLVIFYYIYSGGAGAEARKFSILKIFDLAFSEGRWHLLTIPFQDIGNLFFPDAITAYIDKFISSFIRIPSGFYVGSTLAGLLVLFLLFLLIINYRSSIINYRSLNTKFFDKRHLFKVFVFSFVFAVGNFVLFYIREPEGSLWTTHRYFSYPFVGLALFWAVTFQSVGEYFKRKWIFAGFTLLTVMVYLYLGVNYQRDFNARRSFPAKDFFASFTREVPNIPVGAVTYFDIVNDNQVRGRFGNFFGGMFSEASNLAIYNPNLDYMKDFIFTYKFDDILTMLSDKTTSIDKVFTFYYKGEGLVNTTHETRELLTKGHVVNIDQGGFSANTPFETLNQTFTTQTYFKKTGDRSIGENPQITILPLQDTPSVVPSVFSFFMRITPQTPPLPYATRDASKIGIPEKTKIFSYLLSQTNFRSNAKAEAASYWKDQEPKLALDGRLETAWRGHRGFWDNIDRGITQDIEYFDIKLPRVVDVACLKWFSAQKPLVPIHYRILVSTAQGEWRLVKEIQNNRALPEGTLVVDFFPPAAAKFVRIEILETYGNDGPEIKEFEVVESRFCDLEKELIEQVEKNPFGHIEDVYQYSDSLSYIRHNAVMRFYFMSDADTQQDMTKYVDLPFILDGREHEYAIQLPASGLRWTKFTITGFNFPTEINVKNARIVYQSVLTDTLK